MRRTCLFVKVSAWLGRISLTLYLSHRWVAVSLNNIYKGIAWRHWFGLGNDFRYDYTVVLIAYLVGSACACTVVYLISKYIRANQEKLLSNLRKKIFSNRDSSSRRTGKPVPTAFLLCFLKKSLALEKRF